MELPLKELVKMSSCGGYGSFGVEIKVHVNGREFTENDKRIGYELAQKLEDEIRYETLRLDPEFQGRVVAERLALLACFPTPIYVQKIKNGYGSDYYYRNLPWYAVTTHRGIIEIGWRKRVINIDWERSEIKAYGGKLFRDEEEKTTVGGSYIHAWSYEKAKEYIDRLLAYVNTEDDL